MISTVDPNCVVQTRFGLQFTCKDVSHDVVTQHKKVCKQRSATYHLRCCGDPLFVATRNVRSLVECVGDARICCVTKSVISHPDFPVD